MSYKDRIDRVCDYIAQHPDSKLTLDELSDIAALSKFHFHRVFTACTGLNVFKYIQLSRLKRASSLLVFKPDMKVIDIALESGFDSHEAFSRSFKKHFDQTPSQFRKHPNWPHWHTKLTGLTTEGKTHMNVSIINFKDVKVAVLEHHGSPQLINNSKEKFISWRRESGLSPVTQSRTFGIPYSDPNNTPDDDFHFDLCGSITHDVPANAYGIITKHIPAGRCTVVRHTGSLDNISDSVYYLYRDWLPDSEEELRDYPCFFEYLNISANLEEHELITDIYLPLK